MATEITMPQLGESVVEGTISKWLKQPGERVEKYEPLLEVMTDKVDTEVPAPEAGVVREIVVPEGSTVKVGTLLALLDDGAPDAADAADAPTTSANGDAAAGRPVPTAEQDSGAPQRSAVISPVVARLAAEHNLDLGKVRGTGANGRVTKQDVMRYLEGRAAEQPERDAPQGEITAEPPARTTPEPLLAEALNSGPQPGAPTAAPRPAPADQAEELPEDAELIPVSPMRRAIAEHMLRSRQTAPHVTTVFEVDLGRVVAHREQHKAEFERQGVHLTYTAYFALAAVAALQEVPAVNASYTDEGIMTHQRVHLGVAVALDEGLIVPVLRDADEKNLLGLARAVNDLSSRARARRLKPNETQGGTFTITNHGVGGSLFATPIINQPQGAILGVGAMQKRAVVVTQDGQDAIAIRPMCYLSLTIDHRLLDGAVADRFLAAMKRSLETL